MDLHVLDVGDGACSVLIDASVMVVDCGSGRGGRAEHSAGVLGAALDEGSALIDTVVITHFDADHWKGLWALPEKWSQRPAEVTIYYPYLLPSDPGLVQASFLVTEAATAQTPVTAALDIINTWTAAGVRVHPRALARGDRFRGAGKEWTVHWPPRNVRPFTPKTQAVIEALAEEIRRVASENDVFADAIRRVQSAWFEQGDGNDGEERLGPDVADNRDMSDTMTESAAPTAGDVITSLQKQLGTRGWTDLRGRIRKYNNALSLVHTTDSMANFGDCEGAGLTALLSMQGLANPTFSIAYPVILAPHHGTQIPSLKVRRLFPFASVALVCQNGRTHYTTGLDDEIRRFRKRTTSPFAAQVRQTFKRHRTSFTGL